MALDGGRCLAMRVFPHFFEHTLTHALVPLVAALTYELTCLRRRVRTSDRSAT